MHKALKDYVIKNFCEEYLKGRTPNPCVRCNQYLKFGILLKKAISLGAEFLGTGHYARIYKSKVKSQKSKVYSLRKAADKFKDQSYFLYRLSQPQLKRILFPIGDYTKEQVRILAKKFSLPVADKVGSQDICFLPSGDYRTFLAGKFPEGFKPGLIMDKEGNILGQHKGIALYTIGQRQGLRIAKGYPLYIIKIDPKTNQITVGNKAQAQKKEFLVKKVHYICGPLKKKIAAKVKIRYNHKEAEAEVMPLGPKAKVHFRKPQFAITSGQSAVFYSQDKVLGGGIIEKVLD
jgi:tRNA-specific 2-thiouridylase